MNESKSSSGSVTAILKFSLATWVNAIIYILSVFLVNLLVDKAIFGMYDLMITASTTLMSIVTLGFDHAYLRFYYQPPKGIDDNRQIATLGLIVSLSMLVIVTAIVFLLPTVIGNIFFEGQSETVLLLSMCFTCLAMVVMRYFNIAYRMQNNILMFTLVSILLQFFTRFFYIFGVFIVNSFTGVVVFNLIGLLFFVCLFFIFNRKTLVPNRIQVPKGAYLPLFSYSLGIMPSSVFLWGNQLVNKLFISAHLGEASLGLFSFAALISQALSILQGGFANFWSAYMFTNYETEGEYIMDVHDLLMLGMMILMCLLVLISPIIFIIFSGFAESRNVFGLLLFAPLLMVVAETTVYGIEIAKKTLLNTIASLISVITNIVTCILLIPVLHVAGAAFALVISTSAMFIFRTVMAQRFYRSIRSYMKTTASLLVMGGLSIVSFVFDDNYLIVATVAVVVLIYYSISYLRELKIIMRYLKRIFTGRKTEDSPTDLPVR
ncbi:MAG: oligosaccharide flippase family protein [Oscillospiraceae bacterium]|nr:oligosaccharide flippase family protein [Oscillospiraceae bacterium]